MNEFKLTTPVVYIVFNRLDCTQESFETIRKAKPSKLYIICDGPRKDREGEAEKVQLVREYIESHIDWECDVKRNYAEANIGLKYRIAGGLDWVFEQEEQAIIVEDDCVPNMDFYRFCQEMLQLYQNDEQVWMIGGLNTVRKQNAKEPYFFSKFPGIWGWATWRRAWQQNDLEMKSWPEVKRTGAVKYAYDFFSYRCFLRIAKNQVAGRNTWDVPWHYTMLVNHAVGIIPSENLVSNVGCGREDACNTIGEVDTDFSYGKPLQFPLHKIEIKIDEEFDKNNLKTGAGWKKEKDYILYLIRRIIPKMKQLLSR